MSAQIIGQRKFFDSPFYHLDKPIVEGNSGGPVLDMSGKVIGVAARGVKTMGEENSDQLFGMIPINNLLKL